MIAQHLKKIGIQIDVLEQERTLMERRRDGNELQTVLWANDGSEMLYSFPPHALPMRPDVFMGNLYGKWYASGGSQGKKPEDAQMLKALETVPGRLRAAGRRADQRRQGDLEDPGRGDVLDRDGRALAGRHGRPGGQEQHGERAVAADERDALPDPMLVAPDDALLQELNVGDR